MPSVPKQQAAQGTGDSSERAKPTQAAQPIILVRGFGGLGVEDEKRIAYQGFNDGTVYPKKRGENYIYEGLILRFMKSNWSYVDATNVVGYYNDKVRTADIPRELAKFDPSLFSGHQIVIDPATALTLLGRKNIDLARTLWVFRYYDLDRRDDFKIYGEALVRLIAFVEKLAEHKHQVTPKVNIIAHSMGGLIVREAIQCIYPTGEAAKHINKIVTLGTPHKGISFQLLQNWIGIAASKELEQFNPELQKRKDNVTGFNNFAKHFPPERVLTVVGTNYRTYGPVVASWLNRAFSVAGEFGPTYNRSDGLVKQANAELPGAPRTFVHKCHGGPDSLVTSREAFEIATRFFFGNIKVRLSLARAKIKRGHDRIGKSEFFFGVSIKPRGVDFDLFHQSVDAENCYGPFAEDTLTDKSKDGVAFNWADGDAGDRVIWDGWLDTKARVVPTDSPTTATAEDEPPAPPDIVMRLNIYVSERDIYGMGFSDNVVFHTQYYARAVFADLSDLSSIQALILHANENFKVPGETMRRTGEASWEFDVGDPSFEATFALTFAAA